MIFPIRLRVYAPVDPRDNNIILGLQPKKHPPEIIRSDPAKSPSPPEITQQSHLQVIWRLPQNRGTGMYRGYPHHPSQTNFDGDLRIHHDFGNFHQPQAQRERERDGPLLFFCGNEGDVEAFANFSGFLREAAAPWRP